MRVSSGWACPSIRAYFGDLPGEFPAPRGPCTSLRGRQTLNYGWQRGCRATRQSLLTLTGLRIDTEQLKTFRVISHFVEGLCEATTLQG